MGNVKALSSVLILILVGAAFWPKSIVSGSIRRDGMNNMTKPITTNIQVGKRTAAPEESPFACNMLALDAEGRRRHKVVMDQMKAATREVKELSDGYGFRFQAEHSAILLVSEFVARERLCCPFFAFEIVAEREGGPLWLNLRGREGVKAFIKAELGVK